MKVSVFNDDKKTELIGETFISLEKVIVPGGGQNDLWHNLQFKGRYAGEIRIEMTYYDTRPKEETLGQSPNAASINGYDDQPRDSVGGPRQPGQPKRRPLPADPTSMNSSPSRPTLPEHAHSSPLPYTPHRIQQAPPSLKQGSIGGSFGNERHPSIDNRPYQSPDHPAPYDPHALDNVCRDPAYDMSIPDSYDNMTEYQLSNGNGREDRYEYQDVSPSGRHTNNEFAPPSKELHDQGLPIDLPTLPPFESRFQRSSARQATDRRPAPNQAYSSPNPIHHSTPDVRHARHSVNLPSDSFRSSPLNQPAYNESPLRQHSYDDAYRGHGLNQLSLMGSEAPPPPPPAHRSSGAPSPIDHGDYNRPDLSNRYSAPVPLDVRDARGNPLPSPLSRSQVSSHPDEFETSTSPSHTHASPHSMTSISSRTSYNHPSRRGSQDPQGYSNDGSFDQPMPPSLVSGYDPRIADDESERQAHERRMNARHSQSPATIAMQGYERTPPRDVIPQFSPLQSIERQNQQPQESRIYRSSVPLVRPQATSPGSRMPLRKSLSPQPEPSPSQNITPSSLSSIPFGPDSYDDLNPQMRSSKSINSLGARYTTPEQSRHALAEVKKEVKLETEGPIIGADGEEIDPSDHLPTDTWATEYIRKAPERKGPEIKFRFRQPLQGSQPMPEQTSRKPRETVIRPQIFTTNTNPNVNRPPVDALNDNVSPISPSNGRNRLQKKPPSAVREQPQPRPASEYPLKEHINYGSSPNYKNNHNGNISPQYGRNSYTGAGPPPIPAKVPLGGMDQEDWGMNGGIGEGMDALSEEMKRIDIGVGGVGGGGGWKRAVRGRY